jgi:hypothetical protein
MNYEPIYEKETGDKKPDIVLTKSQSVQIDSSLNLLVWYSRFSSWLSARLEKAEKENKLKTQWGMKALKKLNEADCLMNECSATITGGYYYEGHVNDIHNLLNKLARWKNINLETEVEPKQYIKKIYD